jgi:hypothetical protein
MMGGAKNRVTARTRETLVLANGPHPKITPQTDELPRIYLSHTVVHRKELEEEFLKCSGTRYRCFSFVYLEPEAIYWSSRALEAFVVNVAHENKIMLDSGAFSFQMFLVKKKDVGNIEKLRQKTIEQYVQFCKKHGKDVEWYVTFDYDQNVNVVWDITKKLEKVGLKPVPVYHGDQSLDWLKKYLDAGYTRIGISSLTRRRSDYKKTRFYLDQVFRTAEEYKVKLHGFAVTSIALAYAYPWHSVDSSSWSRTASYGAIYALEPNRGTMTSQHISLTGGLKDSTRSLTELSPSALRSVRQQVEKNGFDFEHLRRSLAYRFIYNAWVFVHLNEHKDLFEDRYIHYEPIL